MIDKYIDDLITEALKKMKEPKEATGTGGGSGSFEPALNFQPKKNSLFSDDETARSEYVKGGVVKPKKVEATEETGASSSGSFETTSFLAKNAKNWGPSKKTQIPGGAFVEVKKKCKTFPYCNQGNTGAVKYTKTAPKPKLTKRTKLAEAIYNVSQITGLSEEEIKNIIIKDIDDKLN
jgi:hypothetical protein